MRIYVLVSVRLQTDTLKAAESDYAAYPRRVGTAYEWIFAGRGTYVAGTRDEGLMQTAEAVTNPAMVQTSIDAIAPSGDVPPAFELLYEVAGLGRTNLDALIVHAAELDRERITIGQLVP